MAARSRTATVATTGLYLLGSLPAWGLAASWLFADAAGYLGLLETVAMGVGVLGTGGAVAVGARHFGAKEASA